MNLWYFHLSSNLPSALEEFKTRHEVEGRGGLKAVPPDPPPEHAGVLKPVWLRDPAQGEIGEKCSPTVLMG